jgi:hypothetical protein
MLLLKGRLQPTQAEAAHYLLLVTLIKLQSPRAELASPPMATLHLKIQGVVRHKVGIPPQCPPREIPKPQLRKDLLYLHQTCRKLQGLHLPLKEQPQHQWLRGQPVIQQATAIQLVALQ